MEVQVHPPAIGFALFLVLFLAMELVQTVWMFYRDTRMMKYQKQASDIRAHYENEVNVLQSNYKNARFEAEHWMNEYTKEKSKHVPPSNQSL